MEDILQLFLRFFQPNTGDRVAIAVSPEEEDSDLNFRRFRVNIFGKVDGEVQIALYQFADVDIYGNVIGNLSMAAQAGFRLNIYGNVDGDMQFADTTADSKTPENQVGIVLQPGNSLVKHFADENYKMAFLSSCKPYFSNSSTLRI